MAMKVYSTIPTEELRELCIKNDWFTCGSNAQYEKMFYANENRASLDEIVTIIWLCSDNVRRIDIRDEILNARHEFLKRLFG